MGWWLLQLAVAGGVMVEDIELSDVIARSQIVVVARDTGREEVRALPPTAPDHAPYPLPLRVWQVTEVLHVSDVAWEEEGAPAGPVVGAELRVASPSTVSAYASEVDYYENERSRWIIEPRYRPTRGRTKAPAKRVLFLATARVAGEWVHVLTVADATERVELRRRVQRELPQPPVVGP